MQNILTECSNVINYNNSTNIHRSKPAEHFNKTCCEQTDQQADIVSDRAAFAAKNAKYKCKMHNITTK